MALGFAGLAMMGWQFALTARFRRVKALKELPSLTLLGIAAIIITLAVAYWLVKRGVKERQATH